MALSTVFELIKQLNAGMLKGAKELAKKEGYTGGETLFLMQTTTGKVLFDIADRRKLDETLVKVAGDVLQGIILRPLYSVYGLGFAIDIALTTSGNSLGNVLLDYYQTIKRDVEGQYWTYEKDYQVMVGGKYIVVPYAKVAYHVDGTVVWDVDHPKGN